MSKIAFVFAGQGAQYSGMGKSLCERFSSVKKMYESADEYRTGISSLSFGGSDEELRLTVNTQPCVFLADVAASLALSECGIRADMCAGFSLGELAALTYGGVMTVSDAFEIVCARAECMNRAALAMNGEAAMAAVMKISADEVEKICAELTDVYPVNYNSPGQTAISGTKDGIAAFCEKANGVRVIPIPVSGAFHSPFMNSASDEFSAVLEKYEFKSPSVPIYANLTGEKYPADVASCLAKQMKSPVRWQTTIEKMTEDGADVFIECGAGKTLAGLIKRINKNAAVFSVQDTESLEAALAVLGGKQK